MVELHTGSYAGARSATGQSGRALDRIRAAAEYATGKGLQVNAGHGLNYSNVQPIAAIPQIRELNIGHAIVAAFGVRGHAQAVREMKALIGPRAMIYGIGIDVVEPQRIARLLDKYGERFARRVLTPARNGQGYLQARRSRSCSSPTAFAAKEAFSKAMGTGFRYPVTLQCISVVQNAAGKPSFEFHPNARATGQQPRHRQAIISPSATSRAWPAPAWCIEAE